MNGKSKDMSNDLKTRQGCPLETDGVGSTHIQFEWVVVDTYSLGTDAHP